MRVTLRALSHSFPDDVDLLLVGPGGQNAIILSDVGGGDDVFFVDLTLDDDAASNLPDAGPLVEGTFKPTNFERERPVPGARTGASGQAPRSRSSTA